MKTSPYLFTVADFASIQAQALSRQALPVIPAWIYPLASPFSGYVAGQVNKVTCKIVLLDNWFQHAMDALVNAPTDRFIDDDGTLLWALEDLENELLHCRARILQVVRSLTGAVSHGTSVIRDALNSYARTIANVFESVQAYGWAVQEHDADAVIIGLRNLAPLKMA